MPHRGPSCTPMGCHWSGSKPARSCYDSVYMLQRNRALRASDGTPQRMRTRAKWVRKRGRGMRRPVMEAPKRHPIGTQPFSWDDDTQKAGQRVVTWAPVSILYGIWIEHYLRHR